MKFEAHGKHDVKVTLGQKTYVLDLATADALYAILTVGVKQGHDAAKAARLGADMLDHLFALEAATGGGDFVDADTLENLAQGSAPVLDDEGEIDWVDVAPLPWPIHSAKNGVLTAKLGR
jgi:hypothetical protein